MVKTEEEATSLKVANIGERKKISYVYVIFGFHSALIQKRF